MPVREELEAGLDGPVEDEEGGRARADEFGGEGDDEEHVREGRVLGTDCEETFSQWSISVTGPSLSG